MRRLLFCITSIFIISLFCSIMSYACTITTDNNVQVTTYETEVANIKYEIKDENGDPVPDDKEFILKELPNGGENDRVLVTEDSTLTTENVPFGDYVIKPTDNSGLYGETFIRLNIDYVDTQHEFKDLVVYHSKEKYENIKADKIEKLNTRDNNLRYSVVYVILFIVSSTIIIALKRGYGSNET